MKKIFLSLFFISFAHLSVLLGQDIDAHRIFNWKQAGVQTDIPEFSHTINFLEHGGSNNGLSDNSVVLNTLITQVKPGTIIFFPEGNYLFTKPILITKDSIVLQGEGLSSRLIFDLKGAAQNLILITGNRATTDYYINDDIPVKQKYVISEDAHLFVTGEWVQLLTEDSNLITSEWAYQSTGQILQIEKISADTIYFKSEFRREHLSSSLPRFRKILPRQYVGIEHLYIERTDAVNAQVSNIFYRCAVNSWILGIESNLTNYSHVHLGQSAHISIKGSYFHHAHDYGNGGKGYGILLQNTSGDCLVENNILNNLRHSVLLQSGANGNVIAYNHSLNPFWTGVLLPSNSAGDMVLHGNYSYANLFEGNHAQHIVIDDSHGQNGPYNTFFRNKASGYGFFMNNNVGNSTNIIGNDITNTNLLMGLYTLTGSDNYTYGNRVKGANNFRPSGTSSLDRVSFYLCDTPTWWTQSIWPNLGTPYPYNTSSIPATQRWNLQQTISYEPALKSKYDNEDFLWYRDSDGDGYGDKEESALACKAPEGFVGNNLDCDDKDLNVYPSGIEIPNDGIDQDCDGEDLIITNLENIQIPQLMVYPNPAKDVFWVETKNFQEGNYDLIIIDVSGRIIMEKKIFLSTDSKYEYRLVTKGSYFIQIIGENVNKCKLFTTF